MKCKKCGFDNTTGTILCDACGDPLEMKVGISASESAPFSPPSSVKSGMGGFGSQTLRFVEGGKATGQEVDLPEEDFEFLVGRTDLDEGIIPDIDLAKFGEKVTVEGKMGYTFSRKQALVSRRMESLYLKSIGGAKTMHFNFSSKEWKEVPKDGEVEIHTGDKVRFGGSSGYVIFELAEEKIK